jgi:hypothetical protein
LGMILIMGIAIFGTASIYLQKDTLYVWDIKELKVYKYTDCNNYINSLPNERLIVFPSFESIDNKYTLTKCD